jgi:competence protein ComEC
VRLVENTRCGAAHWTSTRPADVACERERHARYWQHSPEIVN